MSLQDSNITIAIFSKPVGVARVRVWIVEFRASGVVKSRKISV